MKHSEFIANIVEALEDMHKWRPLYKHLLHICNTKSL